MSTPENTHPADTNGDRSPEALCQESMEALNRALEDGLGITIDRTFQRPLRDPKTGNPVYPPGYVPPITPNSGK